MKITKIISISLLYLALAFFTFLMIKITLPYLAVGENVAFLRIKRTARTIPIWQVAFYIHVFTSIVLLFAGFTQFSKKILRRSPRLHRRVGMSYVIIILFLSGPSGFVMSLLANGGIWSRLKALTTLTVFMAVYTAQAWQTAIRKDFATHREWMMRSYALTLSALTLRAWKWLIVFALAPPPMDVYRIVAWLGWIPNLMLAEWLIRKSRSGK